MSLTESQKRALRWILENPSTEAAWTINGKDLRAKDTLDKANTMRIAGAHGSILIGAEDLKALRSYITHCTAPDKLYDLNEAGRAALAA